MSLLVSSTFFAHQEQMWPARRFQEQPRRHQAHKAWFKTLLEGMATVLTPDERSAVAQWSQGALCKAWNAELVSGNVTSPQVHLILSAFKKMRAPRAMTTYAGLSAPTPQDCPWPLVQGGCTSTSLSSVVALKFADRLSDYRYGAIQWSLSNATQLAVVRIPAGHPVLVVKGEFTELEVLLPPHLTVRQVWMVSGNAPGDRRSVAMYQLASPSKL